jgi:hypothetical protein
MPNKIANLFKRLFEPDDAAQPHQPVIVRRKIFQALDELLVRLDGKAIFPHKRVQIRLAAAEQQLQERYQAVFIEGERLRRDISEHLRRERCEWPRDLRVEIELVAAPEADFPAGGVQVLTLSEPATPPSRAPHAWLQAVQGRARQAVYQITKTLTYIGRTESSAKARGSAPHQNDFIFEDEAEGVNTTVSRGHAYIKFDEASGAYHLFDYKSTHGAGVVRAGRLYKATAAAGVQLQEGDELCFGEARVLFFYRNE